MLQQYALKWECTLVNVVGYFKSTFMGEADYLLKVRDVEPQVHFYILAFVFHALTTITRVLVDIHTNV